MIGDIFNMPPILDKEKLTKRLEAVNSKDFTLERWRNLHICINNRE